MIPDEAFALPFKALAHPRRAMIFRHLSDAPGRASSFASLQTLTGLSDTTLVHHLREMERCGLVVRKRAGVTAVYRLTPGAFLRVTRLAGQMVTQPTAA